MSDSRNDGLLYTGMTSASFAKQKAKKEEDKADKQLTKARLLPVAEIILDAIAESRVELDKELRSISVDVPAEDLKSTIKGIRYADERMLRLETKFRKILTVEPVQQGESFDE